VVVEGRRAAQLVDPGQAFLKGFRGVVEELQLVGRAGGAALGAGLVVRDHHDQRVAELAGLLQKLQQAADVMVGVRQEPGEHFHHPRRQPGADPARHHPRRVITAQTWGRGTRPRQNRCHGATFPEIGQYQTYARIGRRARYARQE
jgi:hypothetical protein